MARRTLLVIASVLLAAAGTALVWVYVQRADDRARDWAREVSVLVATGPIQTGTSGKDLGSLVAVRKVPAGIVPEKAYTAVAAVGNRRTTIPVLAGQVLTAAQFDDGYVPTGVSDANVGVAVAIDDPNRVAGLLRPESHVAIYKVGAGTGGSVTLLYPDVRVIAIGGTTNARDSEGAPARIGTQSGVAGAVVTLDLPPSQAPTVVSNRESLYFALLGKGTQVSQADDIKGPATAARPAAAIG